MRIKTLILFVVTCMLLSIDGDRTFAEYAIDSNTLSNKLMKDDTKQDITREVHNLFPGLGDQDDAIVRDTHKFVNSLGAAGISIMQLQNWLGTNEEWQKLLPFIEGKSGTYVGIGFGGQNLSFLAKGDFDKAIILDNNPFVTEGFIPLRNALIAMANNRAEYLSFLAGIEFNIFELQALHDEPLRLIEGAIDAHSSQMSRQQRIQQHQKIWNLLEERFPEVCSSSYVRAVWGFYARRAFNTKKMLQSAHKGESWLSGEDHFYKIKSLVERDGIQTINANWLIDSFDEVAQKAGLTPQEIGVIYLSNIFDMSAKNRSEMQRRAEVVRDTLSHFGIQDERVVYEHYGEYYHLFWDLMRLEAASGELLRPAQLRAAMRVREVREHDIADSISSLQSA